MHTGTQGFTVSFVWVISFDDGGLKLGLHKSCEDRSPGRRE